MKTPDIIYEDNHIIVAIKPAGVLSQGDYSGETSLLDMIKEYVRVKYSKSGEAYIGLIHRLDRPVSGLIVFARTSKAAARMQKEFTSGRIEKYYIAVIENGERIEEGWTTAEGNLLRERDITRIVGDESGHTERGILHCHPVMRTKKYTMVLVKLDTGKKHQIRAQLSGLGCPVAGDKKYGSGTAIKDGICLHSAYLAFIHPTLKSRMEFYSPPPDFFKNLIPCMDEDLKRKVLSLIEDSPFRRDGRC